MENYKLEYCFCYYSNFKINLDELLKIIESFKGIINVRAEEYIYNQNKTYVVFEISKEYHESIIFTEVTTKLGKLLKSNKLSIKEKMW